MKTVYLTIDDGPSKIEKKKWTFYINMEFNQSGFV